MNEVQIPLKLTGIGSMKAELRSLKAEIAAATDPKQMEMLAQKAGELSDRIKDANDAVNVFASGSKFEQISNSFGGIRDSLMSLDFEEASQKSQVFANNLGKIGKADISTAIKGITGTIKTLGGAFVKLGVQILANPIFLLAAVIVAIVVAIGSFLKKIGVLDKIFNAINAALKPLIEGFKQLTEWLGLSTAASDDAAEKVKANNEKIIASSKERAEEQSKGIEQEIQLAQSLGKETTDLEIEKTKVTEREAKKRLKQTEKDLKELGDKRGTLAEQERARLKKQLKEENALIKQAQIDRKVIINKAAKEEADAAKVQAEKDAEAAKSRAEAAAKAYKEGKTAIQKEIAAANKLVSDSGKTQQQKEVDDATAKYDALIKEAKKYKQDTTALETAKNIEVAAINKTFADQELARQKEVQKGISDFLTSEALRQEAIEEQIYQAGLSDQQRELEANKYHYENLIAEAERYGVDATTLLQEQKEKEEEINKRFREKEKQDALDAIEQAKQVRDARIQAISDYAQSALNLTSLVVKDQKKLEQINKASALIQIGIDTAKAISGLVAASQQNVLNGVTGGLAGAAQFASGILQITTNMVKAKQLLSNPSGSVSGSSNTSSSDSSTSATSIVPQVNLFGQGNDLNTAGQTKSVNATPSFVVQAIVSETDITNTQTKINKIKQGSEL